MCRPANTLVQKRPVLRTPVGNLSRIYPDSGDYRVMGAKTQYMAEWEVVEQFSPGFADH